MDEAQVKSELQAEAKKVGAQAEVAAESFAHAFGAFLWSNKLYSCLCIFIGFGLGYVYRVITG